MQDNLIKPEIAAPGASVSAEAGTGTSETAFGGTSGAAPMVTGAAALLMQAYRDVPSVGPAEIKQLLINTANAKIANRALDLNLAPIMRIGGGEVRVDQAFMDVIDFGPFTGNTEEHGIVLFSNGDRGPGNRGGATADSEVLIFLTDPSPYDESPFVER